MARNEPYIKFNNIQTKSTIESYYGRPVTREDLKNPEHHKIMSSIFKRNIKYGLDSPTHHELEGIKRTLGFEIETVMGRIEEEDYIDLNIKAEHDGSLRPAGQTSGAAPGGEYVTGVLYGDAGFKHLYDICKVLNKYCDIDNRAGVHVHIGSLNWTNEDIVYSYILAQKIEAEMFSLLPKSRLKNSFCRKIRRLFTASDIHELQIVKKQSNLSYETLIDNLYNRLFREVSGGVSPSNTCNGYTNHPKGSKCQYDKSSQRYCWLNYVTLLFNTKDNPNAKTLEIRSHSATLNYLKIKNWSKIWIAFTEFVNKHKDYILNDYIILNNKKVALNLENICLLIYPKTGNKLVDYMQKRKTLFKTETEAIDYVTSEEPEKTLKEVLDIS